VNTLLKACETASTQVSRRAGGQPIPELLRKDPQLRSLSEAISRDLHQGSQVFAPKSPAPQADPQRPWKAVTWNIERGKNFPALRKTLLENPRLNDADFYFLTEVDWGMARSGNRNVAAELGEALGCYAYFAASYFNFTLGHGSERHLSGENSLGLHGKALLSRFPLENIRAVPMSNTIDKLRSKEARLGEKCALLADLKAGTRRLTLACTHLDAFSSPRARALQLGRAVSALQNAPTALVAGDWNTNTLNTTHGPSILWSVLKQIALTGPQAMIRRHYPGPERKFDRPLFQMLEEAGFDFANFNEPGIGTYDLVSNDKELGQMAHDQFPGWVVRWINRQIEKGGGKISLKIDWFAARGLRAFEKQVVPLQAGTDYLANDRPSDHHPISLRFSI